MTLLEAIDHRSSRRKYLPKAIEPERVDRLCELIEKYNNEAGIRMQLITDNGEAFNGLRRSYGMFSGVRNYIGLIAGKTDTAAMEKLGYYGEKVVLEAEMMGLSTCWVGGSFSRELCPFELLGDEMIVCTIAIGYAAETLSGREKFIQKLTHRKTKRVEDMYVSHVPAPEWFLEGMRAVQRAPSAVNRQPVKFRYEGGVVTASIPNAVDVGMNIDFGIAKLHFELGAGGGSWQWGLGGRFTRIE